MKRKQQLVVCFTNNACSETRIAILTSKICKTII